MKYFEHIDVNSVEEASQALQSDSVKAIAGGTDLLGVLKDKILPDYPDTIINLKTIEGINKIESCEKGVRIGATVKLKDIETSEIIRNTYPILAQAANSVASPLIRNQATIGGNICQDVRCWYYRYPNQIGGRVNCLRKGGEGCSAFVGEHYNHSIFGGMRVNETACTSKCPANVNIPAYMNLVRAGDIEGAAKILLENNPLPAITSRVCTHFCQEGCNRGNYDEHVGIGQVERYVGDYILEHADILMAPPEKESGKQVAVIGSGPSGLSAAYYMRKAGHKVVVYDKMEEPGGLLMYAIPAYRLPKEVVRKLIQALKNMGIEFQCETTVGEDIQLDDIVKENDSVYISTGAWKRTVIGIDGEDMTRFGLEFLVEVKSWMKDKPGSNVVVVGGGNVAVDVAVTAKRLGASSVTMVSLEKREELPATNEEMERAIAEGINHMPSFGPHRVLKENGKVTGIELIRCTSVKDENGRFAPKYDKNDLNIVKADAILLAVGQRTDLSFLDNQLQLEINRGRITVDERTQMTSQESVYAGGDVVTGPSTAVNSIAAGKRAAFAMEEYLIGSCHKEKVLPQRELLSIATSCLEKSKPVETHVRPETERTVDLEDDLGLTPEEVKQEADRCFNCSCYAVNPSDTGSALLCLNAQIFTNKRTYTAEEFFTLTPKATEILDKDEIVTAVAIPTPSKNSVMAYDKFRDRASIDFATIGLASNYEVENGTIKKAKIILGAVAPVPIEAKKAEDFLAGKVINEETATRAAELALEDANPLSQNRYKVQIAKTLVKRSIIALTK